MSRRHEIAFALSLYFVLSCAMTWPLVTGLARDVPGDLGDSLLNMWILGWGAESVPRLVTGHMTVAEVANANIFHPEPLTLAFSEHLFAQVLQILPIYHLTGNLILCYNLLFLGTFVLSGLGMYLLVLELTGNRSAALLAGLIFAFVPYRVAQLSHLQSLSAQWMPLALYGFRRYITTSRVVPFAGGALALLMQNWSCGYYLIYFAPLIVLFVIHQIVSHGRLREFRVWGAFAAAALGVGIATWPFLGLYLEAQRLYEFERPIGEIIGFSADVYSYLTASSSLRVLGSVLQTWPKPEGELFLGFVPAALALIAILGAVRDAQRVTVPAPEIVHTRRRFSPAALAVMVLGAMALVFSIGLVGIVLTGGFVTSLAGVPIRATNAPRILLQLLVVLALLAAFSKGFRRAASQFVMSDSGIASLSLVLSVWLSLGPVPRVHGETVDGMGIYGALLTYVPGFDGLRVPARYAMIAAVYLSILAGIGAARFMRSRPSGSSMRPILLATSFVFLVEAAFAPMPTNQTWGDGPVAPPARVEPASRAPAVYRQLATMADNVVVAEFPFGDPAWELRYVYYSTVHWKRILNGYSGGFPQAYKVRVARLQRFADAPDDAWAALRTAGTTHVVAHEAALTADEARALQVWLEQRGGRQIGRFDSDVLYDLSHAR